MSKKTITHIATDEVAYEDGRHKARDGGDGVGEAHESPSKVRRNVQVRTVVTVMQL